MLEKMRITRLETKHPTTSGGMATNQAKLAEEKAGTYAEQCRHAWTILDHIYNGEDPNYFAF